MVYICKICGEEDYEKAPHCKCEREYEKQRKSYQPERSKREDLIEKCNHKNDLREFREKSGRCFDPLCSSCKDAVL